MIEQGVFADPWSKRDFGDCVMSDAVFLVAEAAGDRAGEGGVVGYVVAHDAAGEGEILNLAVAPARHRRGIGRALVEGVLAVLSDRGVSEVFLEVRESNAGARALYDSLGFREVGRRARYYRRPLEDAVVLRAAIPADGGDA
jgi:[ribosomal protein S18]-alanine N-acetyltransferase